MPIYAKSHSHGEFVFDWAWAEAYMRAGLHYYPKLVVSIPFTPATGPRLLYERTRGDRRVPDLLVEAALEFARRAGTSTLHWLFVDDEDGARLSRQGHLTRIGCQFHWRNPGYRDFQDYLDGFTSKRRKAIRRERREAAAAPVEIELRHGTEMRDEHWAAYHALYASTYDRKYGYPALTRGFLSQRRRIHGGTGAGDPRPPGFPATSPAPISSGTPRCSMVETGAARSFHASLHFEICYYRAIEYCIARGLSDFDAGAQGEHKILRGFLPVPTRSAHWIRHRGFREAIERFLVREEQGVRAYIDEMRNHSPFKHPTGTCRPSSDG